MSIIARNVSSIFGTKLFRGIQRLASPSYVPQIASTTRTNSVVNQPFANAIRTFTTGTLAKREILNSAEIATLLQNNLPEFEKYLDDLDAESNSYDIKQLYAPYKQYGVDKWEWPEDVRTQHDQLKSRITSVLTGHNTACLAYFDHLINDSLYLELDDEDSLGIKGLVEKRKKEHAAACASITPTVSEAPKKFPWEWFRSVSPVPELVTSLEEKEKLIKEKQKEIIAEQEQQLVKLQNVSNVVTKIMGAQSKKLLDEFDIVIEGIQYEIDNWKDIAENIFDAWDEDITAKFPEIEDEVIDMVNNDIWDPDGENDWSQKWWLDKDHHGQPLAEGAEHHGHGH